MVYAFIKASHQNGEGIIDHLSVYECNFQASSIIFSLSLLVLDKICACILFSGEVGEYLRSLSVPCGPYVVNKILKSADKCQLKC